MLLRKLLMAMFLCALVPNVFAQELPESKTYTTLQAGFDEFMQGQTWGISNAGILLGVLFIYVAKKLSEGQNIASYYLIAAIFAIIMIGYYYGNWIFQQ